MTAERSEGLVIRLRPLGDTSLIVHWLTPEHGRLATVAKAARGPKSPLRGKLDWCFEAEFSFRRNPKGDLHSLSEVVVRNTHVSLRREVSSLELIAHAVATIELVTETETPQPEVHRLFLEFLAFLEIQGPMARAQFAWDLRFLAIQGLEPDPEGLTPEAGALMEILLTSNWSELAALEASQDAIRSLRQYLHGFWIHQFGRSPGNRNARA
jgi:DNA repair protein RecO (recombination protein O)